VSLFKTVLFDFDGTLVDTNELITESFKYTLTKYNHPFTEEELKSFNGPPLIETFRTLDETKADLMVKTYQEHNLAHHEAYLTLFPHVEETLQALHEAGIKLGIVSTKMRNAVDLGLDITNIRHYFDSIITLNDVTHAKPDPEPVIKGMGQLNGERETTLMVGDNHHDIVAGHNAQMATAGVSWSLKGRAYLQSYEPTYMLEDMWDLLKIVGV